ncbi:MAG: hypothetical protein M3442_13740 [Chloroflexota bacterium]|nr:hypothetical protein [Chloroflexota bacterium]
MKTMLDPLVARALRSLHALSNGALANRRARPAAAQERPDRLVDAIADRLQADSLPGYAALDVGLWGPQVHRSVADAALRVQAVALTGDELSA